jgi:hypothetical protein
MIVCHSYRFIFLKTYKTAGTSIEIALSKHCGPRDTITPILAPGDEEIRRGLGYPGPQNYTVVRNGAKVGDLGPHTPARVAKQVYPREWETYFKFAVTRNPWEVCASGYARAAAHQRHGGAGFSEYIASADFAARASKWRDIYSIDGRIVVDHVCRYENLAQELEQMRLRVGLPEPLALPNAKSGHRRGHYREVVNPRDAQVIARLFAQEIELFGYEY